MMSPKFKIYSLMELVDIARTKSPYYKKLYGGCDLSQDTPFKLADLPIVNQTEFWQANSLKENKLLTAEPDGGIVFRSGGTTGSPKFSIYSRAEWDAFTIVFGQGLTAGGLLPRERIANCFYGGSLYASFLFIYKSLENALTPVVQYPIAGNTEPLEALRMIDDFGICTIAGVPTGVMTLAQTYALHKKDFRGIKLKRILFGGESMHLDQRRLLGELFPGVQIVSAGYASVDAGLLGYADPTCGIEEHRVFGDASIIEIVDEVSRQPIVEPGKPGLVLITNLTRSLMPIIRYPAGDRAEWVDDPQKTRDPRFRLLGRSEEAARVGPVSLYFHDIDLLIEPFKKRFGISAFQMEVHHHGEKDGLVLRLAVTDPSAILASDTDEMLKALFEQRPMLRDWAHSQKIHPSKIEWTRQDQLEINPRTGKMRRIIDRRY